MTLPAARDHTSFDIDTNLQDLRTAAFAYSHLTRYQAFKYPDPVQTVAEGDATTGWEVDPDRLHYTFKLRPGVKFDSRAPTSGREVTTDDMMFSWDYYVANSIYAGQFAQSVAPTAPFMTMEAPDDSTIVVTLAFPYAPATVMTGYYAFMALMPSEADGQFDAKLETRGSAAWRLDSWVPSSRIDFVRNSDWYDTAKVNLDGIAIILMPEFATQISQFRSGNLTSFGGFPLGSLINQEDILPLKADIPQASLLANENYQRVSANSLKFSQTPESPFKDARVRQAASMLIERDLLIRTIYNADEFEASGLPVGVRWDTAIPAGEEWWLDPLSDEFGEAGKFLRYDPEEAKALLSAAGFTQAIEAPFVWSNGYADQPYPREAEIVLEMLQAHGDFSLGGRVMDHNSEYREGVIFNNNMHDGIAFGGGGPSEPDVDVWLTRRLGASSRSNDWGPEPDPRMEDFLAGQRQAIDREERAEIVREIQRYYPTEMRFCLIGGAGQSYIIHQPWLGNAGLWRVNPGGSESNETWPYLWIDDSKK